MMNTERLKKLKEFLAEDPQDAFLLYAIANEYVKAEPKTALVYFEKLMEEHPEYVATYYQVAHLMLEMEMREKAEAVFQKGIEVCKKMGEQHALSELQSAYNNYLYEE